MASPMDLIISEARANRTVIITARKKDGSTVIREVEPYSFRLGANGNPNLYYFCRLRNDLRNTRVSDILFATATGNSFTPRWPVEL